MADVIDLAARRAQRQPAASGVEPVCDGRLLVTPGNDVLFETDLIADPQNPDMIPVILMVAQLLECASVGLRLRAAVLAMMTEGSDV
jgi:hypothetical protein